MKRLLVLAVLGLFSLTTYAQSAPADPAQDPSALTGAFFKAMQDEDSNKMQSITTDDFSIVNFDGNTADRDLLVQALSGGHLTVETATPSGMRARSYNNDAAVVTGTTKFKGSLQGQALQSDVLFTAVCVKQGNGWKVANVQFSPIR
ncbi:nuclear transport factor 2 family protein [Rudanella lutea]|jgi:ketosteroid isomerase-like protein|uniref:nuclear transport factor 2 family protein n=1 Tax=Rudanella lutea TaxID=451374 RepID=UPI0003A5A6A5|nr:nuclear transport factor 2 family protein [Rudanella lutea]